MIRRKRLASLFVFLSMFLLLAACGSTSEEKVLEKVEKKLKDTKSYRMEAEMKMHTGKDVRSYNIDVIHQKEASDFFRVTLMNEADGQVILKNEEGVFIFTPNSNKSFKFQTDWPENSSQPYLYQSIVRDVLVDDEAVMTETDDHYLFDVKTNYEHQSNLPYQQVFIDKKTWMPVAVNVLDQDKNTLIEVSLTNVETNIAIDPEEFQQETIQKEFTNEVAAVAEEAETVLEVKYPLLTFGATLEEQEDVELDDGKRVIMTFKGENPFTFIQEKQIASEMTTKEVAGELVELGDKFGAMYPNTIEWTEGGVDYYLASESLTESELLEVAQSIEGTQAK
ncbi:MAG TPA: outer membrane lipoprotein carrier protein LolA [Savagea sp.]